MECFNKSTKEAKRMRQAREKTNEGTKEKENEVGRTGTKSEGKKEIQAQMVVRLYRTSGATERMEALYEGGFQDVEVRTR